MRPLLHILAFGLAIGALAGSGHAAESLRWESDLRTAFERARVLNRPLLLHFSTDDCVPCRRLEQTVFTQPHVRAAMQDHFVPVKIDANDQPEIAMRYGIRSVPHDVIVTANDEELHRMTSPPEAEQYLAQLSAVAFRAGTIRSSTPLAQNGGESELGRSGMDRRWSESGRDPSRPDPRFHDPSAPRTDRPQVPSNHTLADRYDPAAAESYAAEPGSETEEAPREVINRFARRGQHELDPREAAAPDSTARQVEPPAARSRWDHSPSPDQTVRDQTGPPPKSAPAAPFGQQPEVDAQSRGLAGSLPARGDQLPVTAFSGDAHAERQPGVPPMGMDGYCPVSLVRDNRWIKGDPRFGVIHRGRTYLFAGAEAKEIFFADPDEYSPVLAGIDPVQLTTSGETIEGRRAHGVVYRKRVYLFSSEANLQQFWEEPERYAGPIRQAMENGDVGRLFR